ncbi:MAG: arylsulfatase [Planctomycetes bacterium]|nr:arylsulfatase [Planctomycetota bacterium]
MHRPSSIFSALGVACAFAGAVAHAQEVLPRPEAPFRGVIGRTAQDSVKSFPEEVKAPAGAPNVLLVLIDDAGYGVSSAFGGPVPTATLDRVAQNGLRYTHFHTTALCSPTRAALLAGRNHHSAATGVIMELGSGFPGYNSLMPKSCGTFAEVLRQNGYGTAWYGKNHNVPDWQGSQAGPYDLWPTGLGFEYFYGFIGGDANQWAPALYEGTQPIEPPENTSDYHLDPDLADRCIHRIRLLNSLAPERPWLQYYAPGTSHAPHHAPKEWIAKFKGRFDQGWDVVREETFARQKALGVVPADAQLTPRAPGIPAWDSLKPEQKRLYAHMMEVYAAALAHCDHQIGRILSAIEDLGQLENTLVIYIMGDNGASAEGGLNGMANEVSYFNGVPESFEMLTARMEQLGGPLTYNHYPIGWAHAMCTPFQWAKQIASHFGGTRNGMAISWPARIKARGEIRTQFHHVIDIAPTILEAAGVAAPSVLNGVPQRPIEGVSMLYSFDDAKSPSRRRTQYFEMFGYRAIYHDGWVAATTPPVTPWDLAGKVPPIDEYAWELYHVEKDFSQAVNLAEREPAKLRELQDIFWIEAAKYQVLPLDNSRAERMDVSNRPSLTRGRSVFTYFAGQTRIPEGAAPDFKNKSWQIAADVVIPAAGAEGVLITQGGRFNGWGLYLQGGKLVFHYNLCGVIRTSVVSPAALTPGEHVVKVVFHYDGGLGKGGALELHVDQEIVAKGRLEHSIAIRVSTDETLDIGEDTGTPVSEDYQVPHHFTGTLKRVLVRLGEGQLSEEDEAQIRRAKAALGSSR